MSAGLEPIRDYVRLPPSQRADRTAIARPGTRSKAVAHTSGTPGMRGRRQGRTVTFLMTGAVSGRLMPPSAPMVVGTFASASTTSMPAVTLAKIT